MYGKRARIGLIVPSSNTVCEPEMARLCPEGVNTYAARIMFSPTIEGLEAMKDHVARAGRELASEGICQLLAFCCTIGSMIGGPDYDTELSLQIEKETGLRTINTTSAVKAAFTTLGVKKLALATPYTKPINEKEKMMLEASGFEVASMAGYFEDIPPNELKNDMIGRLQPQDALKLGLMVNRDDNEAIFISCTNFRTIEIIDKLEKTAGKPVITSNQATMWHALRTLGFDDQLPGFGKLLSQY